MLDTVESKGSHAIIEILVRGFYPTVLADQRLHDATEAIADFFSTALEEDGIWNLFLAEMLVATTSERQGRVIDQDPSASMEKKKQEGYF